MIVSIRVLDDLASRIERAYCRRRLQWNRCGSDPRVWEAAAAQMAELHRIDPSIPLDPELFVAAQTIDGPLADPWRDLAQAMSAQRYRRRVRQIVRSLKREITAEIRYAEMRVRAGEPLDAVLNQRSGRLSALGRYISAQRAGRSDLRDAHKQAAQEQHRACPLYRQACTKYLSDRHYPVLRLAQGVEIWTRVQSGYPAASSN